MFVRNVLYTFSIELLTVVANLLAGIVLARRLTPADRGIMVLIMTVPVSVVSLVNLGLPQANIYLIGKKQHNARKVLGNSLLIMLIFGLLAAGILSTMRDSLVQTVLQILPPAFWLPTVWLVPVLMLDTTMLSIMCARQRFDLFNMRRGAGPILMLIGFSIGLVLIGGGLGAAVAGYTIVTVLLAATSLLLVRHDVPLTLGFDPRLTRDSLQFGLRSYVHDVLGRANYRIDVYLLAMLLPPEQVAFYGVATSLAEAAWYFPNAVGTVLFPRLSSAAVEEVSDITAKVCRNTLALTSLLVAGLLALGWFFVPLAYGPAYRAVIPPLLVLLPGVMMMVIYKVLTRAFTSQDQLRVPILAAGAALTLNLGLDWLLVPRWGIMGAALGSTAGYIAAGVLLLIVSLNKSGADWREMLLPKYEELVGHWHWFKQGVQSRLRSRDPGPRSDTECPAG